MFPQYSNLLLFFMSIIIYQRLLFRCNQPKQNNWVYRFIYISQSGKYCKAVCLIKSKYWYTFTYNYFKSDTMCINTINLCGGVLYNTICVCILYNKTSRKSLWKPTSPELFPLHWDFLQEKMQGRSYVNSNCCIHDIQYDQFLIVYLPIDFPYFWL